MRLQLSLAPVRRQVLAVPLGVALVAVTPARADDHVTVRGAYYRETSTRVVQPVVEIRKELPDDIDLTATYLLDAITSASVAAGTTADSIFTELRNDVSVGAGWSPPWGRLGLVYRYSAESDYWSHGVGASVQLRLWGDSGTLALAGGASFDGAWPRARTPNCPTASELVCRLNSYFGTVSYTQVVSPTWVVQVPIEISYLDGFQSSLYRAVPNLGYEVVPNTRLRGTIAPRVGHYLPRSGTGFQIHYRYYRDDWSVAAHTIEGRIYQEVGPNLEVRGSLRYYSQTPADFWCDWMARPDCYGQGATVYTADPKLQHVHTWMPELKLTWDAVRLRGVAFLGWFSEGAFEISYARFIQNTSFGDAHLLQMGYTLPY